MEPGDTFRITITKTSDDRVIYSIVDALDGELLVSDILPVDEFLIGLEKLINKE